MRPLIPVLTFLFAVPYASGQQPVQGCPDPRAWEFIKLNYPSSDKPDPSAFLKLDATTRQRLCNAAPTIAGQDKDPVAPPKGISIESGLSTAGKKFSTLTRDKNPFGAAHQSEFLPEGSHQGNPQTGGFKPQQKFKPPVTPPKAPAPQPAQKALSIQDGSRELIDRYGDPHEALCAVITARGGDECGVVTREERRKAWKEINAVVGGLKDPDALKKGESDERLRDFDHFLNAFGGIHGDGILRPNEDDGFFKGRAKILGRTAMGVGGTVITTCYTAVKWFDQTFGASVGMLAGYDFNSENTSKASLNEAYQGVKGVWYGVYTTDYGARPARKK